MLLAGYAYAHFLNAKVRGRPQALLHTILLLAAVALLPIAPGEAWKPSGGEEPISRILLLLGASVGLPYLLLASTSPLLQAWYVRANPGSNPYRLFAISNVASLARAGRLPVPGRARIYGSRAGCRVVDGCSRCSRFFVRLSPG